MLKAVDPQPALDVPVRDQHTADAIVQSQRYDGLKYNDNDEGDASEQATSGACTMSGWADGCTR